MSVIIYLLTASNVPEYWMSTQNWLQFRDTICLKFPVWWRWKEQSHCDTCRS